MKVQHTSPTVKPGHIYAGVVIELPEPLAKELQDWRISFGDQTAQHVPSHITLLITPQDQPWEVLAARVRAAVKGHAPFHVEVKGTGTFRPVTPVVFLRLEQGFEQCVALHQDLAGKALDSASPFEYHPHVTLAHAVTEDRLDHAQTVLRTFHATFLVDHLSVYEGTSQGEWVLREQVPLDSTIPDDTDSDFQSVPGSFA